MQGLTHRQQMVLDYIRRSISDRGYPPTLREIGAFMGIRSTNGVNDHLRALERKGYLTREDMKSRARWPTNMQPGLARGVDVGEVANGNAESSVEAAMRALEDERLVEIPVVGRVAAGLPILAEQNVVDTVKIDKMFVRGGKDIFALRVQGESMIEAGILDGDYIFVRKQATASRGDIVVALLGDEATVKYYFPEKEHVRLQPANAAMAPIYVRASDFKQSMILGIVVTVLRKL